MQITSTLMMIRPVRFEFNAQTATSNAFQDGTAQNTAAISQQQALEEFEAMAAMLRYNDIEVVIFDDTPQPHTPDSIFPNNWISFHRNGTIILYPMAAPNRREERRNDIVAAMQAQFGFSSIKDYSGYESKEIFLEGTGSMVLDRENKIAYACVSPRTHLSLLQQWCADQNYACEAFTALDAQGKEIYHTNVMMCIGEKFAVVCLESISDLGARNNLDKSLAATGHEVIAITLEQMNHFAGNMLQVKNKYDKGFLVLSSQAYHSLNSEQVERISRYCDILHSPLHTIETLGGGSARCMLAEVFAPDIA